MEVLLSVKGIGRNRAEQVINILLNEEAVDGTKT